MEETIIVEIPRKKITTRRKKETVMSNVNVEMVETIHETPVAENVQEEVENAQEEVVQEEEVVENTQEEVETVVENVEELQALSVGEPIPSVGDSTVNVMNDSIPIDESNETLTAYIRGIERHVNPDYVDDNPVNSHGAERSKRMMMAKQAITEKKMQEMTKGISLQVWDEEQLLEDVKKIVSEFPHVLSVETSGDMEITAQMHTPRPQGEIGHRDILDLKNKVTLYVATTVGFVPTINTVQVNIIHCRTTLTFALTRLTVVINYN